MSIIQNDIIEISHLTSDNQKQFGVTDVQLQFINDLLYRCTSDVHNKVLNNLYKDGIDNARYKLTSIEATKLINCLTTGVPFQFIEYNTPEWHIIKLKEIKLRLINNNYVDYNSTNSLD